MKVKNKILTMVALTVLTIHQSVMLIQVIRILTRVS